ncbi:MAG: PilW family protein [Burkholderiales bacterium]
MITTRRSMSQNDRGFTLIELMVAMTIGLMLTLVVANLFLGSRATFQTTDETSRMQENIRYAYQLLTRSIHHAGYRSSPNTVASQIFNAANQAVTGTDGGGTASDSFTIRYQGSGTGTGTADGSIVNCTGAEIDAAAMTYSTFTIAAGANGGNALMCDNGAAGGPVEVVPDVENMQVLFGEDTNADMVADRYVSAPNVTNFDNVISIRVSLLFRTANISASVLKDTGTFNLSGTVVGPFNDTRIRRVVTLNMNLRNRTP